MSRASIYDTYHFETRSECYPVSNPPFFSLPIEKCQQNDQITRIAGYAKFATQNLSHLHNYVMHRPLPRPGTENLADFYKCETRCNFKICTLKMFRMQEYYMGRTILLKYLTKFNYRDTDLKIILLVHQNNYYVEIPIMMCKAAKVLTFCNQF